jgi:hypothetical protein
VVEGLEQGLRCGYMFLVGGAWHHVQNQTLVVVALLPPHQHQIELWMLPY